MLAPDSDVKRSWWQRFRAPLCNHPTILAAVVVVFLLKGARGGFDFVVEQCISISGSLFGGDSAAIEDVLRQTAPLALSAAIITCAALRRWLPLDSVGVLLASIVIVSGAWVGNEMRYRGEVIEPVELPLHIGGVLGAMLRAVEQLLGYLRAYQLNLFLASLVVGIYLGWTWHRGIALLERPFTSSKHASPNSAEPKSPAIPRRRAA